LRERLQQCLATLVYRLVCHASIAARASSSV
jgi:hypothetical protein